jgi:NADPH-dependent ferric siderophore reductase
MMLDRFTLSGTALPVDAERMLCDICSHFVEHSEVRRNGDQVTLESQIGEADIRKRGECLEIRLSCPTARMLQMTRNVIAEHLFMFAGEEPLQLDWSDQPQPDPLPDFREVTVVSARQITPHMRRLTFACRDIRQFLQGGLHVRLLIPPKGREPVWPRSRPDGRIAWPRGEDELKVRIYTICQIDLERGEMDIDFVLHESCGQPMPGAEFAINAQPGDIAGLLGPGGGGVPEASEMILAGDETALPAISRIAAEVPAGTRLTIAIEVADTADEQPLASAGEIDIRWLHRHGAEAGTTGMISEVVRQAVARMSGDAFVWVGCERSEARTIRDFLKLRGHDRQRMSVGAYWQRTSEGPSEE